MPALRMWQRVVLAVVAIAALTAGSVKTFDFVTSPDAHGCAEMTDSVGLYRGNDVTMRGVPIGKVTDIQPYQGHVRVAFDLHTDVDFPADVSAVTTSDSIVTDRRLEIPSGRVSGAAWDMSRCIPLSRTHTPKSVSDAYASFEKLSREITTAANQPGRRDLVRDALTKVNATLAGTGGDFNQAVAGLAAALGDPALRDSQLRRLLTNVDELTQFFIQRWPDLLLGLTNIGKFAQTFDELMTVLNPVVEDTTKLVPPLVRVIRTYSPDIFRLIDAMMPLVDMVPTEAIIDILRKLPIVKAGLQRIMVTGAASGGLRVAPPRVRVPARSSAAVCAYVNRVLPQGCRAAAGNGGVDVALVQFVLGGAGGRR